MTLRARLLLAMGALLALALIVSGGAVVGLTRASLLADLDRDLLTARVADVQPGPPRQNDPTGRRFALLLYNADGETVQTLPSGFASAPDPLPEVAISGDAALPIGIIVERPAIDGSLHYRVLALRSPQGPYVVLGAPMRGLDGTIASLMRILVLVGLVVLGLLMIIGWLLIRRDLRPLERMTATAERISSGDLSQRVGVPDDGSEVGKLGHAFDGMLDQIESSFASQQQALRAKEASEQMLRQFVADASHELRTPLTTIRGNLGLLQREPPIRDEDRDAVVADMVGETDRLIRLVNDLLLLARSEAGRPRSGDESVPLAERSARWGRGGPGQDASGVVLFLLGQVCPRGGPASTYLGQTVLENGLSRRVEHREAVGAAVGPGCDKDLRRNLLPRQHRA